MRATHIYDRARHNMQIDPLTSAFHPFKGRNFPIPTAAANNEPFSTCASSSTPIAHTHEKWSTASRAKHPFASLIRNMTREEIGWQGGPQKLRALFFFSLFSWKAAAASVSIVCFSDPRQQQPRQVDEFVDVEAEGEAGAEAGPPCTAMNNANSVFTSLAWQEWRSWNQNQNHPSPDHSSQNAPLDLTRKVSAHKNYTHHK
jgi:hypothetical protein